MVAKGRIPTEILDEIRERIPIERVIGEYVPLKRAGRHFKGSCPFHQEKTPSFTVNTDLQIFKCFGCGESGNIFGFLMKFEGISFFEAIQRLAQQAGVELPAFERETREEKSEKDILISVLKKAWRLFHECLLNSSEGSSARKYLQDRGYGIDEIKRYGLGYVPESWDYLIKRLNVPIRTLETAGLVIEKPNESKCYDRFRNRLIFPIREFRRGDIVAFGGRTLGDDSAKYINSPESPVYNKSKVLYGFYEARQAIRKAREVILVEGYFDRLALDSSGIHNVVAPCGTSLTIDQVRMLKRSAQLVYLLFDADVAGITAAKRALELCLGSGLETLAVPLPEGMDPDDIIQTQKVDGLRALLDKAIPALDFLIQSATTRYDITRSQGRRQTVEEMVPFLMEIENSIDRGSYIARISDLVRVPTDSIMELLRRHHNRNMRKGNRNSESAPSARTVPRNELDMLEKDLIGFFILHPEYINWEENPLKAQRMRTDSGKEIYRIFESQIEHFGNLSLARIVDDLDQSELQGIIVSLFDDPGLSQRLIIEDPAVLFQSLVQEFETRDLKVELNQLRRQLLAPEISPSEADKLLSRQMEIIAALNSNKLS